MRGVHVLLALWERFDLALLLTQSGVFKLRSVPTWKLAFLVVAGLITRCSSCLQMMRFYTQETLLKIMLGGRITQSTLSRFLDLWLRVGGIQPAPGASPKAKTRIQLCKKGT